MCSDTLKGQVAIVTGGGRGIGRAISLKLASGGMSVAVLARNIAEADETVERAERDGGFARAYRADVTDARSVCTAVTHIERNLGPVKMLVNNAGQVGPIGPFHEADLASWWRTVEVNLHGAVKCTQTVLSGMIARRQGRIVNVVTSTAPFAYLTSYVTSKTALIKFTEIIAAELEPHGIGAFALIPGTVRTPLSEQSLTSIEGRQWLPWFGRIFAESLDVPAERPAALVMEVARGRLDALSGRVLSVWDDIDTLTSRASEIRERRLYSLRVNALPTAGTNRVLDEIRAAGEVPQRYVLQMERLVSVPAADLFRLWVDPAAIHQWFIYGASVHWHAPPRADAKPGGRFDWCVAKDTDERDVFQFTGEFLEIRPNDKIAFTWDWEDLPIEGIGGPGRTVVEITFEQEGANTTVGLLQTGLVNEAARAAHRRGWERCLDGMEELLGRSK